MTLWSQRLKNKKILEIQMIEIIIVFQLLLRYFKIFIVFFLLYNHLELVISELVKRGCSLPSAPHFTRMF